MFAGDAAVHGDVAGCGLRNAGVGVPGADDLQAWLKKVESVEAVGGRRHGQ